MFSQSEVQQISLFTGMPHPDELILPAGCWRLESSLISPSFAVIALGRHTKSSSVVSRTSTNSLRADLRYVLFSMSNAFTGRV